MMPIPFHPYFWLAILSFLISLFIQHLLSYIEHGKKHDILNEVPVLLWWNIFIPYNEVIKCQNSKYKCLVTSNRTFQSKPDIYLFYGSQIQNDDFPIPRNMQIPWALFHEESPKNYAPILFEETQSLFNITSTFSQYSDFPLTLQYLGRAEYDLLSDIKYYIPVQEKNNYLDSIAPVLYIQSDCDTPIGRDYLVEELSKYIKIDSYGKCLRNKEFPIELKNIDHFDLYNEHYLSFISKYKFIIAFENAVCEDYITEKLWRPLVVGSVPIYLGSPSVEMWLPNANSAILAKNFDNLQSLAAYITKVNNNDTLYHMFLEHKIYSRISNYLLGSEILPGDPIEAFQCFVCEKLHENVSNEKNFPLNSNNVYNCPRSEVNNKTTWHQHWDIGECQSKVLRMSTKLGKPYKKEYFDEQWTRLLSDKLC